MKGVIELPLEQGKKELGWFTGYAPLAGLNTVNPVISLRTEKGADFVAKRLWLVQWPAYSVVPAVNRNLALPPQTTGVLRDGQTKRGLSLVSGNIRTLLNDTAAEKADKAYLGLPSPYLLRGNTNIFVELANPGAVGTPWTGDVLLVAEGYNIYPYQADEIPAKIRSYAFPFDMNANQVIAQPTLAGGNLTSQSILITNNGEGKFIAKSMQVEMVDAAGVDVTAAIMPCLGLQVTDTYSGSRKWIQSPSAGQAIPFCPAEILTMHRTGLPFNMPRYLDPFANVSVQIVFPQIAGALAYLAGAATWPVTMSVTLKGALLPA